MVDRNKAEGRRGEPNMNKQVTRQPPKRKSMDLCVVGELLDKKRNKTPETGEAGSAESHPAGSASTTTRQDQLSFLYDIFPITTMLRRLVVMVVNTRQSQMPVTFLPAVP